MERMIDLEKYTLSVCEIARRAGAYIREERRKFSLESVERKHAHDYVSYVDKGSEKLIVSALRELLPEAGFITEEGTAEARSEECGVRSEKLLWVVDPLDGTTNFIHQYAPYAVSIALLQGRTVLLGVVYEICADECFYAWQGGGAYVSRGEACGVRSERLRVSGQKIQDALLCFQFPYNSDAYKPVIQRLIDRFYGHAGSIRACGSAAMALCNVAAGRLDGYAEQYIGQWDYMAGSLIVMEAGGTVTDFAGSSDFTQGNSVVATNGLIQQDLLKVIMSDNSQERFPLVDEEGRVVGSATRGECHSGSRLLHPVVHLHVFNSQGEVYLQKRPEWKDIQPGKWDTAVGGHIDYGETPEEALTREVREELGITDFVPERVGQYVFESRREREYVYVHKTVYDGPVSPSASELDGGRFWRIDEIRAAIGQGILTPNFESEFQRFFLETL